MSAKQSEAEIPLALGDSLEVFNGDISHFILWNVL